MRASLVVLIIVAGLLFGASPAKATPITATVGGCIDNPAVPTEYAWSYGEHFQAVVFHDPIAGCGTTIYQRVDYLLEWTVNYNGTGGLQITSRSAQFPTCGRLQFDMHKYLTNGTLDPLGLVSLVVNFGGNCDATPPRSPEEPPVTPVPERPSALPLVMGALFVLFASVLFGRRERFTVG